MLLNVINETGECFAAVDVAVQDKLGNRLRLKKIDYRFRVGAIRAIPTLLTSFPPKHGRVAEDSATDPGVPPEFAGFAILKNHYSVVV